MRTLGLSNPPLRGATWLNCVLVCLVTALSLNSGCATTNPTATLLENPKTARDYYQRGTYFGQSRPLEAIPEYTQAIALDEEYTDAYLQRSRCWIHVGNYEAAVTDLTQAVKLRPKQADYYQLRAMAYTHLDLEDIEKAIADYDTAIALNPKDYWGYLPKAALLFQEARFAEAIPVYREFLAKSPNVATEVASSLVTSGLVGVLLDPGGTIRSARGIAARREQVKEMIKLCERMLQQDGLPVAARPLSPGMTESEVLPIVMTTDRIVAESSAGKSDHNVLVTVSRMGPIEDRILRVLVLDKGQLALEKRVPLREVMEIPGVAKFADIPVNPTPSRSVVSELIGKTDHLVYEDDGQIVTVTEWETQKGKRVRFLYFNQDKLTWWTRFSRKLW
jgi:hypothetical protein